ncbi:MAG: Mut7-C RNAse domain-containing protein [Nitrospirae bacterium]|nr:Mut7-C RNAse domain-containing protein [Nitrospirota bacterium]
MRFIADEMLGRLAKWLRILGYDTAYFRHIRDSELLRLSVAENRILLTRDTLFIKRRGLRNFLFISYDKPFEQIRQVVRELSIPYPTEPFTRCVMCNNILEPFTREDACRTVPEYVCKTQDVFGRCSICHKIYWKGTHYERMERVLGDLFGR